MAFDMQELDGKTVTATFNFYCGRALICLEFDKWGYIDETGNDIIPCKYADAWHFSDDAAIVYLQNPSYTEDDDAKWGVIDTDGNMLFTKRFVDMTPSEYRYSDGLLEVRNADDETLLIDKKGKKVAKVTNGYFNNVFNGLFVVYNNEKEKVGLMNSEGEWIMKQKYESMKQNGKLVAATTGDDKWVLYTTDGEKIANLPEGGTVELFSPEFKDCDNAMLIGSWGEGFILCDGEGNEIETKATIYNYNTSFNWGFMDSDEGDGDYYEEGDYDEDYSE